MQRVSPRALLLSFAGIGGLIAGLLIVFMLMGSSAAPKAQAIVPTKTPTPGPSPTPKVNDAGGVLSGLFDTCAGAVQPVGPCTFNPSPANTLYACMVRSDESSTIAGGEQAMKTSLECGSTLSLATGAGSPPTGLWHGPGPQGVNPCTATVPGEGTCGARTGYSAGPPYTSLAPYKLNGFYCQSGPCAAPDGSSIPTDGTWQFGCLPDFGTSLGPNVVVVATSTMAVANNPTIGNSSNQSAKVYLAATNAQCTNAQGGTWTASLTSNAQLTLLSAVTRRDITRKTVPGTCTDMQKLWQNKPGSATKCPQDPFNPNAPDGAAPDVSGTWDITAEAVRADVGVPGLYYNCLADIQQTGKNLDAAVLCVIDGPTITVNREVAGGNGGAGCPPDPKFCGDGQVGAGPPGCSTGGNIPSVPCATLAGQGAGCPLLPCDTTQYNFADIESKHTHLTGVEDNTSNTMNLSGCFEDPEANGPLGNVKVLVKINIHTGAGKGNLWINQPLANCMNPDPTGKGPPIQVEIASVRQAPGAKGACTPNVGVGYTGCRDSDGDGCPDKRELADTPGGATGGGLRDPSNPWDYFNPEKVNTPHAQTVADILYVVGKYGKNQGNALYTIDADRTAILGGNTWNLGPPDGQQTVADILAAVKQYNQNC